MCVCVCVCVANACSSSKHPIVLVYPFALTVFQQCHPKQPVDRPTADSDSDDSDSGGDAPVTEVFRLTSLVSKKETLASVKVT